MRQGLPKLAGDGLQLGEFEAQSTRLVGKIGFGAVTFRAHLGDLFCECALDVGQKLGEKFVRVRMLGLDRALDLGEGQKPWKLRRPG